MRALNHLKKSIPMFVILVLLVNMSSSPAYAVTVIDFESFNAEDVISGPGIFPNIIFSGAGGTTLFAEGGVNQISGDLSGGKVPDSPSFFRADFCGEVRNVSVLMGDHGSDQDILTLEAFASDNTLLDFDTDTLPGPPPPTLTTSTLSVSAPSGPSIHHVIFSGSGGNSIVFDDFTFDGVDMCIFPEPSPIGGEIIPLDTTMILTAGAQYTAAWMIPILVSAIGIGIVLARKF